MNQNNQTFKHTAIGFIPPDWEVKKLREVTLGKGQYGINASAVPFNENLPKYLRITDIDDDGYFSKDKLSSVDQTNSDEFFLKDDDIVFVRTGATTGKSYLYNKQDGQLVYAGFLIKFSVDTSVADKYFIWSFTKSSIYNDWVSMYSQRSGQPGLNSYEYGNLVIPFPPLPEQQKIGEILKTWDKAISTTKEIINQLKIRNKSLAFNLLIGVKRLKEFEGIQNEKTLIKDIAKEISVKNKSDANHVVFSCTKHNGLVPSLQYFGKQIYSEDLTTYKVIKRNQFAYATNHIEEGSIGVLKDVEVGLISPMYTIFEFNSDVDLDYIFKLLKTNFYIYEYKRRMEGSIDRRGGLRWSEFSKIHVHLPALNEQKEIAKILNTANSELELYQQKLNRLQTQKKGLMQQLLTGKVRTV